MEVKLRAKQNKRYRQIAKELNMSISNVYAIHPKGSTSGRHRTVNYEEIRRRRRKNQKYCDIACEMGISLSVAYKACPARKKKRKTSEINWVMIKRSKNIKNES